MRILLIIIFICFSSNCPALFAQESEDAPSGKPPEEPSPAKARVPLYITGPGSLLFFIDDASLESDPMPILPAFSFALSVSVIRVWRLSLFLEASVDIYTTHYLWSFSRSRALPAAIENRSALVFGFPLGIKALFQFEITRPLSCYAGIGVSADCRIVLPAEDLQGGIDDMDMITAEANNIRDYFWQDYNWLFIESVAGIDYRLSEKASAGLCGRVFIPCNQIERMPDDPALFGWRFGIGLRVTMRL